MKIIISLLAVFTILVCDIQGQPSSIPLNEGWKARRATDVVADGTEITSPGYGTDEWINAIVPGTILTTLLHNKQIPDPFFGMNNNLIPDVYDTGRDYYTYWFYKEFDLPEIKEDQQVWISFRGMNMNMIRIWGGGLTERPGFYDACDKYGILVWKNQNPWTALRGFFYDYYLDYTGGYFGYKHGASPVHIQLNLNDSVVCVLNQTAVKTNSLAAGIKLYDMHGKLISEQSNNITLQAHSLRNLSKVTLPDRAEARN